MLPNALRWYGEPGHYEVYYLTLTDPNSGVGVWIRYTMLAPLAVTGEPPSCSLWFLAMDPSDGLFARKASFPIDQLAAEPDPFRLTIADAELTDAAMTGSLEDAFWDLRWAPGRAYQHVHPLLRRMATTVLVLPHADVSIEGVVGFGSGRLQLTNARGGQAHLWGSKHATSWAWVHCNDFRTLAGERVDGVFVDGVSVVAKRFGREVGPSTPMVGRIEGRDFHSISPLRVMANDSTYALTGWRFQAVDGARKLVGEVDARRDQLVGVTYHDPDGDTAYCYNSETASMRLHLYARAPRVSGWELQQTLTAPGCAHFEYGQRTPVPEFDLQIT